VVDPESLPDGAAACPSCRRPVEVAWFEAPVAPVRLERVELVGPAGATSCAQHPANAAEAHCERCGILMCALCRIDADGMALCPACFERLSDEGTLASARVALPNHDRLAEHLAVFGALTVLPGILTGPLAISFAVRARARRKATGETEGTWRSFVVYVLGLLQCVASLWLFWSIFARRP
jgi:hypothetical protein